MFEIIKKIKEKFSIWDKKQNWNKYADLLGSFWIVFISVMLLWWILNKVGVLPPIVK